MNPTHKITDFTFKTHQILPKTQRQTLIFSQQCYHNPNRCPHKSWVPFLFSPWSPTVPQCFSVDAMLHLYTIMDIFSRVSTHKWEKVFKNFSSHLYIEWGARFSNILSTQTSSLLTLMSSLFHWIVDNLAQKTCFFGVLSLILNFIEFSWNNSCLACLKITAFNRSRAPKPFWKSHSVSTSLGT